jgi:hypothetical protein
MESLITKHKKLSLVIGVILALIAGFGSPLQAEDIKDTESTLSMEDREFLTSYFQRETDSPEMNQYLFFDKNGQLLHTITVTAENEESNTDL